MKLYVSPLSPMSRKTMFVNAHFGLNITEQTVDLQQGEQRTPEFLAINPNGKVPALELDDGSTLWESNAIINRLAAEANSELWPKSNVRYDIMRWQFWEAAHWTPACGPYIAKVFFNDDSVDFEAAGQKFDAVASVLNGRLEANDWLVGDAMTTADVSVAAILCYRTPCNYPMQAYRHINRWIERVEALPAWQKANPQP